MAKRHHRLLSSVLAAMLLSGSMVPASAATVGAADSGAGSLSKYYSTNPNGPGKEAKITVDGEIGDWTEDMKIAQGTANDDPRVYRPNSMYEVPLDLYALYGAYDDSNLYLMWEMTNVQDIVAPSDDYPLSQGILYQTMNIPFFIAIDTGKSDTIGNSGKTTAGGTIWDSGITFGNTAFNRLIAVSTNGANGPFVYSGDSSGLNAKEVYTKATSGIEFKYGLGINSKNVWGLDGAYGPTSYTNPRTLGDMCDDNGMWVDFNTKGHKTSTMDFHYEMSIPFETLGVTKSDVQGKGLGALVIMTSGKSGMDCLPYDLSMNDKADLDDSAGSQENNSFEKSDEDDITCAFARIGNGSVPTPVKPDTDTTTPVDSDTEAPSPVDPDTDTTTPVVPDPVASNETVISAVCDNNDEVTVTLGINNASNVMGISNVLKYDTSKFEFKSAKAVYSGVEINTTPSNGQISWNANLGDGSKGVTFTSDTALAQFTFRSLSSSAGNSFTNVTNDIYDYDFKTLSAAVTGKAEVTVDVDSDEIVGDMTLYPRATANAGDTVDVSFSVDLDLTEGLSDVFTYDSETFEYVGYDKVEGLNGLNVEANPEKGLIKWSLMNANSIGKGGAPTDDVAVFHFKARKNVSNALVGTSVVSDCFDKDGNGLVPMAIINCNVKVNGASDDTDTRTEVKGESKKISVTAKAGDRVVVTFKASGLKNAAGIQEVVDFDKSALTYNNDAASSLGVINADASNGRVAWNVLFDISASGQGKDLTDQSEIAVLSFIAQKDISASDDVMTFSVEDFYDVNDAALDVSKATATAAVARRGEGPVPVTAKAGDTVTVYCNAIDAKKALGIVEELTYDASALEYRGYGDALGHFDMTQSAGSINWSIMFDATGTDLTKSTDLVAFTFVAKKDIASYENVLSYKVDEFYDTQLNDFDVSNTTMAYAVTSKSNTQPQNPASDVDNPTTDTEGKTTDSEPATDTSKPGTTDSDSKTTDSDIKVDDTDTSSDINTKTVTILFGDVDKDDSVTSSDAVTILRTSADMEVLVDEEATAADVNEDTTIDAGDALSVLRFSVNLKDTSRAGQKVQITINFD